MQKMTMIKKLVIQNQVEKPMYNNSERETLIETSIILTRWKHFKKFLFGNPIRKHTSPSLKLTNSELEP